MEEHGVNENFNTPNDQFMQELDALERYDSANNVNPNIGRISLFKQFDPLAMNAESPGVPSSSAQQQQQQQLNSDQIDDNHTEPLNQSATLIHINTPAAQRQHHEIINDDRGSFTNGHSDVDCVVQTTFDQMSFDKLQSLVAELCLINEETVNLASNHIINLQQNIQNSRQEVDRVNSIKNSLEDELNNVEKNYFDTHSRYEKLRSLIQDMHTKDMSNKEKLLELATKLKEKELECRKLKKAAEEVAESQRMQQAANKETISLRAQIKMLEMKVNSLQQQIEQKTHENEELTHIVDELIGERKN